MAKCPDCGTELEWGYCETCDKEIPEGQEITTEATASHPWIVGKPAAPVSNRDPEAQMREEGARLAAQLEAIKAVNGGKLPEIKVDPEDFKIYADTDYG